MQQSPGEFFTRDYRVGVKLQSSGEHADISIVDGFVSINPNHQYEESRLSVVSWNIERGYELAAVIAALQQLDADVVCLQEVDVLTGRPDAGSDVKHARDLLATKQIDCLATIASALKLNTVAAVEMSLDSGGVMCNCILTKFDIAEDLSGSLSHGDEPKRYEESFPRWGMRSAARAVIRTHIGNVLVYSDHFEMHYGMEARLRQINNILEDCQSFKDDVVATLICGDLNTYSGGVARLRSLWTAGLTPLTRAVLFSLDEAEMYRDVIFSGSADHPLRRQFPHLFPPVELCSGWTHDSLEHTTVRLSFIYNQKLDWIVCRGQNVTVTNRSLFNHDFLKSDHKGLHVTLSKELN